MRPPRAPVLGPVGAGLLLQPSGQEVLRDLGLLAAVMTPSEAIAELCAEQVSGRSLIRLPYAAANPAWTGYGVARGLLFSTHFAAAADCYESERQSQVRPYSQLSWALTPFFQSGSRILGWDRDVALPLLAATPPIRLLMARTLAEKLGKR